MPGFVGLPELILLGLVLLVIFGPKRLPELGRSLGHGMREFKESVTGDHKETHMLSQPIAVPVEVTELEHDRVA